jgi:hypothetical protein
MENWRVVNIINRDARSCMHREFRQADVPICNAPSNDTGNCLKKNCPVIIRNDD